MTDETIPSRESSKRLVALAQEVIRMEKLFDEGPVRSRISATTYNELLEKAKSLAGSVISQADPND